MAVDNSPKGGSTEGLYHERQHFQFCLLHCLNNLLQGDRHFTRRDLDSIADTLTLTLGTDTKLSFLNPLTLIYKPHRNAITGNYDVNVLLKALDVRGKQVDWFDSRKGVEGLLRKVAEFGETLVGLVVNLYSRSAFGWVKGRHWVAVKQVNGVWYDLDSEKDRPACLGAGDAGLKAFLQTVLANKGEVLFVLN